MLEREKSKLAPRPPSVSSPDRRLTFYTNENESSLNGLLSTNTKTKLDLTKVYKDFHKSFIADAKIVQNS